MTILSLSLVDAHHDIRSIFHIIQEMVVMI